MDNYEEKYKAALGWMQSLYGGLHGATKEEAEKYFPELKESEDERIRKKVIEVLKLNIKGAESQMQASRGVDRCFEIYACNKVIAWLEKQGEQKSVDKFEPKFKVADWVVWKDKCYKVNYNGCGYELVDQNGLSTSLEYGTIDKGAHLWDITKDAKDGDVLVSNGKRGQEVGIVKKFIGKYGGYDKCFETYCYSDLDGTFRIGEYMGGTSIHPATKEQRDTLMEAMDDAGWGFDFEKKELKKIEHKMLDADKVIEWLECKAFQGWAEPIDIRPIIRKFKKDFGL